MTTKLVSTGVEFPDATTQTTSGVPLTGGTMTGALTTTGFTSTGIDDNATSTAITIDASEKILIGDVTSHTTDLLQIETPASGGGHGIQIRRNDNNIDQNVGHILFGNNSATDLASISAKTNGDADSGVMLFKTSVTAGANTERLRIDSDGLKFNGDTAAANALDDYEEGTWTPLMLSAGTTCDATVSHADGSYTKVGRLVTVFIRLRITSNGTDTGILGISLPFAVADLQSTTSLQAPASISSYYGVSVANSVIYATSLESSSHIQFGYLSSSTTGAASNLTVNQLAEGFDCRVSLTYAT